MPRVSVIIPTHNRPQLLTRAVASAFAAGTDVEVVVVDDASTDDTAAVCKTLAGINYVRVEHNQGVAGARNVGVHASAAEYIALLDDDDVRAPGSLDLQLARLAGEPEAGLIYGPALVSSTDRVKYDHYPQPCPSGDVFWRLLSRNFIPSGSVIFRRACLDRTGLFDPSISGIDDWDLWLRIAALYPVAAIDQPVVTWRKPRPNSDQGSARAVEMVALSTRQFRERWLNLPRAAAATPNERRKVSREFSENMAGHLAWEAVRSFAHRQVADASRCLVAALRFHSSGLAWRVVHQLSGRRN